VFWVFVPIPAIYSSQSLLRPTHCPDDGALQRQTPYPSIICSRIAVEMSISTLCLLADGANGKASSCLFVICLRRQISTCQRVAGMRFASELLGMVFTLATELGGRIIIYWESCRISTSKLDILAKEILLFI